MTQKERQFTEVIKFVYSLCVPLAFLKVWF